MYDTGRQAAGMKGSKAIMEEKKNLLTYAGLKKLEEELLADEKSGQSTICWWIWEEMISERSVRSVP